MKKLLFVTASAFLLSTPAHATPITFTAVLDGPSEFPAVPSPGTGFALVTFDPVTNLLTVDVSFADLVGTTTASHIHCCVSPDAVMPTAGVATTVPTFAGFPLGVTSGTFTSTLDLTIASSFNPAFVAANGGTLVSAEAVLVAGLLSGQAYLNIHTSFRQGGEIRGFLQVIPEPATLSLLALGLGGALAGIRRRTKAPRPTR